MNYFIREAIIDNEGNITNGDFFGAHCTRGETMDSVKPFETFDKAKRDWNDKMKFSSTYKRSYDIVDENGKYVF